MFTLYRKGFLHEVNGIKCEQKNVELGELDEYRQNGWVDDINELDPHKVKENNAKKSSKTTD